MNFKIAHIGKSHAYAYCPLHADTRPSVEITLELDFEGRAYCFSCNRVWQLNKGDVEKLKNLTPNKPKTKKENWNDLLTEDVDGKAMQRLSEKWNVKTDVLHDLGIVYKDGKYLIPMFDDQSHVCGIQCQCEDGFKFCMEGSQLGLFMPVVRKTPTDLFITEGCSDLATVLDLGFPAVGRPNCNSCADLIIAFLEHSPNRKFTILADSDPAGINGAINLCDKWNENHPNKMAYVYCPEGNDVREYASLVGKEDLKSSLEMLHG